MSWTERIATRIAKRITPVDAPYTVGQVSHGIELSLLYVGNNLLLFIAAYLLHLLLESMIITFVLIVTRSITGGVHFKNPWACLATGSLLILTSAASVNLLAKVDSPFLYPVVMLCSVAAMITNRRYAPAPLLYVSYDEAKRKQCKINIQIFLLIGCVFSTILLYYGYTNLSLAYSFAVILQSALLLPIVFRLIYGKKPILSGERTDVS